jgi:hypothetical protein
VDPACCGIPIVYGNGMTNFPDICFFLEYAKRVIKAKDLVRVIMAITMPAKDDNNRQSFACKLQEWHKKNCGASEFIAKKSKISHWTINNMTVEIITSRHNDRMKFLCTLYDRRNGNRDEMFLVEGFRELKRAMDSEISVDTFFLRKIL